MHTLIVSEMTRPTLWFEEKEFPSIHYWTAVTFTVTDKSISDVVGKFPITSLQLEKEVWEFFNANIMALPNGRYVLTYDNVHYALNYDNVQRTVE